MSSPLQLAVYNTYLSENQLDESVDLGLCPICQDELSQEGPLHAAAQMGGVEQPLMLLFHTVDQTHRTAQKVDHLFHEGCLRKWLAQNTNCPTCRQELDLSSLPKKSISLRLHASLMFSELKSELEKNVSSLYQSTSKMMSWIHSKSTQSVQFVRYVNRRISLPLFMAQ